MSMVVINIGVKGPSVFLISRDEIPPWILPVVGHMKV